MGNLNSIHTVNLSGDPSNNGTDNAGDETLNWNNGNGLGFVGAYADSGTPNSIDVTVNLSGENWFVGTLQIDSDNGEIDTVTLTDASTGDLDNDEGAQFDEIIINAGTSTNLVFTSASFDRLEMWGDSADTVVTGFGYYQVIQLGGGVDTVTIGGDEDYGGVGTLDTDDDDDIVNVEGGYSNTVRTGNGSDAVDVTAAGIDYLNTGGDDQVDDDVVTMGAGGNINILSMEGGNNSLTMTGDSNDDAGIDYAAMWDGDDTVSVGQNAYIDVLKVGGGANEISVGGRIGTLKGYNGSNTVDIADGGSVSMISFGADDSSYTNEVNIGDSSGSGTYAEAISLGASNDTVNVGINAWVESLDVTQGTNVITIKGLGLDSNNEAIGGGGASSVRASNGSTTVTVESGAYVDTITLYNNQNYVDNGGAGNIVNAFGFVSFVYFGRAVDTLNIGVEGVGAAQMGRGNDIVTFKELASSDFGSSVSGGNGTDTADFSQFASGHGIKASLATTDYIDTGYGGVSLNSFEKIIGTSSADTLEGAKSGASTLVGGAGDDTYVIRSSSTVITDASGTDTIKSSNISINLDYAATKTSIENATLSGESSLNLTGNGLANTLIGNSGQNMIDGKGGNDTMTGGSGNDDFVFSTNLNGTTNVDHITDFSAVNDRIVLDHTVFTSLPAGWLYASSFESNTTGVATTSTARIIYDTDSGELYYDKDGVGGSAAVQFADLDGNPTLTKADFFVI